MFFHFSICCLLPTLFLSLSGGIQTFIGNELVASARMNKLNFNAKVEVGKWIIPDVAVSVRMSFFNVDGQTQYTLQPFVDYSVDEQNENGYYSFHGHALALLGFVTFDWTNFIMGYEAGKRNKLHVYTPIGLGASMLFGEQRNPRGSYELGSFRRNFELAYSFVLGLEYIASKHVTLHADVELFGSESTWDWTPYNTSLSRMSLRKNCWVARPVSIYVPPWALPIRILSATDAR